MSVGPKDVIAERKVTSTQKLCLGSLIQKFIRYYKFLWSLEKEKQRTNTQSTALARQREIMSREEGDGRQKPRIIFWYFCCILKKTCLFVGFVFTAARLVWDPFSELTLKWGPQLSVDFTFFYLVSNWLTLPCHVRPPTNYFLFSILCPLQFGLFIWVTFNQSEFVVASLLIRFYL